MDRNDMEEEQIVDEKHCVRSGPEWRRMSVMILDIEFVVDSTMENCHRLESIGQRLVVVTVAQEACPDVLARFDIEHGWARNGLRSQRVHASVHDLISMVVGSQRQCHHPACNRVLDSLSMEWAVEHPVVAECTYVDRLHWMLVGDLDEHICPESVPWNYPSYARHCRLPVERVATGVVYHWRVDRGSVLSELFSDLLPVFYAVLR
jgi:hypothetical protein